MVSINIKEKYYFINGYNNYIITESGKVYSNRRKKDNRFVELKIKGRQYKDRYLSVCLCGDNLKYKYVQVHRLVAEYFCDGYFKDAVVNHKDTDIHNNHYTNLEWVTQKDNINKLYISSGVNQVRNFKEYIVIHPSGEKSDKLKGYGEIFKYIDDNDLKTSKTGLRKYRKSNGYILQET